MTGIMLIVCGLVFLSGSLYLVPGVGKDLEKLARTLGGFQALIGVIAVIVGILDIGEIGGVILLIFGLVLAAGVLSSLPAVGKYIAKLARALGASQTALGIISIIAGVWTLL